MQLKRVKMCLLGDKGVGKTQLLSRFCKSSFSQDYSASTGFEVHLKKRQVDD